MIVLNICSLAGSLVPSYYLFLPPPPSYLSAFLPAFLSVLSSLLLLPSLCLLFSLSYLLFLSLCPTVSSVTFSLCLLCLCPIFSSVTSPFYLPVSLFCPIFSSVTSLLLLACPSVLSSLLSSSSFCMPVSQSVPLPACLTMCLSVYVFMSVSVCLYLSVCLSVSPLSLCLFRARALECARRNQQWMDT